MNGQVGITVLPRAWIRSSVSRTSAPPKALAFVAVRDLGVGDDHAVAGRAVLGEADDLAVESQLEPALAWVVGDGGRAIAFVGHESSLTVLA